MAQEHRIKIYNQVTGAVIAEPLLTKAAEHEEELMEADFIRLSWDSDQYIELPVEAYIKPFESDVRYFLLDPYIPEQKNNACWHYEPHFQHPKMYLGRVPLDIDPQATDSSGEHTTLVEYQYTGYVRTLVSRICAQMSEVLSSYNPNGFTASILGVDEIVTISFNGVDILSALTQLANQLECEWHISWENWTLYFGSLAVRDWFSRDLTVGENVNPPAQRDSDEEYFNGLLVQGSTRNMSRRLQSGALVQSNVRLGLDRTQYPNGVIYTLGEFQNNELITYNSTQFAMTGRRAFVKAVIYEDIFPQLELYVYKARYVERYLLDGDTNEKVVDYIDSNNNPVYKKYAIWYVRLASKQGNSFVDYKVQSVVHSVVTSIVSQEENYGSFVLELPFDSTYFTIPITSGSETSYKVEVSANGHTINAWVVNSNNYCLLRCKASKEDDARYDTNADEIKAFVEAIQLGDDISFESGVDVNKIPQSYRDGLNDIIQGKSPIIAFQPNENNGASSCPLAGRGSGDGNGHYGFEIKYHTHDSVVHDEINNRNVEIKRGDYEIIFQQNGDFILPTTVAEGIYPVGSGDSPSDTYNKVSMYNVNVSSLAVTAARNDLVNEAKKELYKNLTNEKNYTVKSNPIAFKAYNDEHIGIDDVPLFIGEKVNFRNGTFFLGTRIIKLVTKLDNENEQEITIGNKRIKGARKELQEKVDNLIIAGENANIGSNGIPKTTFTEIIEDFGSTLFLSKKHDDTARGLIRFIKGLQIGERFTSQMLGEGGYFGKDADGYSYLEADKMYIRMKAYFDTVEIREYMHTAGNRVASVAGLKCSSVVPYGTYNNESVPLYVDDQGNYLYQYEDSTTHELVSIPIQDVDFYRCYFRVKDNENTVRNNFVVGDLAQCHTTDMVAGSLRIQNYWRLVVGRDNGVDLYENEYGWIDLSNKSAITVIYHEGEADQESVTCCGFMTGSDVPMAEDDIFQLGNVFEHYKDRRGAIIEYVSGQNSPSYKIYQNLGTDTRTPEQQAQNPTTYPYLLDDKCFVEYGYNSTTGRAYMNVFGDMYVGTSDGNTSYIKYNAGPNTSQNPDGQKVKIKADIDAQSTFGGLNFDQYLENTWTINDIYALLNGVQQQIDGAIDTWFYDYMPVSVDPTGAPDPNGVPVLWTGEQQDVPCLPYYDWFVADGGDPTTTPVTQPTSTVNRVAHLGDIFYDNKTGYAFRFSNSGTEQAPVFKWVEITDSAVIKALQDAANAQDTADHKRRVFVLPVTIGGVTINYPYPPYDKGDLWVNATYPYNYTGNTDLSDPTNPKYRDDLLRCQTPRTATQSFVITDWELASKYTDDTELLNFLDGYQGTLTTIRTQVDRKAETWRVVDDPSTQARPAGWLGEDDAEHVGDLWMNIAQNAGHNTYIYQPTEDSQHPYAWVAQAVPDAVFDAVDGKSAIFVNDTSDPDTTKQRPSGYKKRDLWILQRAINAAGNEYIKGEILTAIADEGSNGFQWADWQKEVGYTNDDTVNAFLNKFGEILNITPTPQSLGEVAGFLGKVLNTGETNVTGGLVLSNIIYLKDDAVTPAVQAGISGLYQTTETGTGYKGHGTAAWYGGGVSSSVPIDHEVSPSLANYAKILFRFDGSGYLAGGNITWDANGIVTIANVYANIGGSSDVSITTTLQTLTNLSNALPITLRSGTPYLDPQYAFTNLYILDTTTLTNVSRPVATQYWVQNNFVTKDFFEAIFKPEDSAGNRVATNGTTTGVLDRLKILVGAYTDQYLSALGLNPNSGGGGGGVGDVTWTALASNLDTHPIAWSHISAAVSGEGFATQSWVLSQGYLTSITSAAIMSALGFTISGTSGSTYNLNSFLTGHQTIYPLSIYGGTTKVLDYTPNSAAASIYLLAGGDISLTNDTTNKSITLSYSHPTNGANTTITAANGLVLSAITVDNKGHVTYVSSKTLAAADIPDISADYATSGRVNTLENYFTNGVANNAARLTTVSKTAWGRTYWTANGVPDSISGSLSDVTSIEMSSLLYMANGQSIQFKDNPDPNTGRNPQYLNILTLNSYNNLAIGYGTRKYGYLTDIQGGFIKFATNGGTADGTDNRLEVMEITSAGQVQIKQGTQGLIVGNGTTGDYIQIGAIRIEYDNSNNNNALKVYKVVNGSAAAANLYALGGISALGYGSSGGGGGGTGDVTWAALASTPSSSSRFIDWGYIAAAVGAQNFVNQTTLNTTLAGYLPLNGGGTVTAAYGNSTVISAKTGVPSGKRSYIAFLEVDGTVSGRLGVNDGVPEFSEANHYYTIWHAGNFPLSVGTPSNGQVLKYNSTNGRFEPANESGGTGSVTSITLIAGTGISLDVDNTAITTSGSRTINISSTYQSYINHGESAYNSLSSYLPLSAGSSYPLTGHLYLSADKDIRLYQDSSHYAYIRPDSADGLTIGFSSGAANQLNLPVNTYIGSNEVATQSWVQSQGYITGVSGYLPLSGGAMTGMITRDAGGSWISGRDNAIIKTTRTSSEGNDWHPAVAIKTSAGCWTFGSVGGETLVLSYDTDANYNASNNTSAVINFPSAGSSGTLALTSQIPTNVSSLTNDSGYITSSGSCSYATSAGSATVARDLRPENTAHYFRDPDTASWRGGMFWGSAGSEAMSFVVANGGTRFQFVGGSDIATWASDTWASVTPYMEIKSDSTVLAGNNSWLTPARLQLLRPDSSSYTDRACIGVTDGNLHIDSYPSHDIYLNYYSGTSTLHIGSYTAIHSGNIGSQSVNYATYASYDGSGNNINSTYLSKSGGTMNTNAKIYCNTVSTDSSYGGAIEVREYNYCTTNQYDWAYAPGITFHWGGYSVGKFGLRSDGQIAWSNNPLIHSGNIGSQSVNYASSAGSATSSSVLSMSRAGSIDFNHYDSVLRAYLLDWGNGYGNQQGWILDFAWDWDGHYTAQVWVGLNGNGLAYRGDTGNGTYTSWKRVIDSDNIGSQSVSYASSVGINYNNNSNSTYQMLWGSGNSVYGTGGIYCNPYTYYLYSGSFYCSNWFRSSGATGWYNESYGGGWYMEDTSWIRAYNGKGVLASGFYHSSYGSYSYLLTSDGSARHENTWQRAVYSTQRDFSNGTLITTDINYSNWGGDPFYLEIKGNTYGRFYSCFTTVQGYIYNDTIIHYGVTHLGNSGIGPIVAMNIDGNLCFWFPRLSYWEGYSVFCSTAYDYRVNRVTSVTDSAEPAGTKKVQLSDNTVVSLTNQNVSNFNVGNADTVDGEHASAFAHVGQWNNLLCAGNEFNFISNGFSGGVWFNYQDGNRQNGANVTDYYFGNGAGSATSSIHCGSVYASSHIIVATGAGIKDASNNALLAYHASVTGATSSQWFVGASDCQGVVRSNNTDLMHARGATQYVVLDSYNYTSYAATTSHTHSNYVLYDGGFAKVTDGLYINSSDGAQYVYNDSGDLTLASDGGDVVVDNNLIVSGLLTVSDGGYDRISMSHGTGQQSGVYSMNLNFYEIRSNGYMYAIAFNSTSDSRLKDIYDYDAAIDLWDVAYAPAIHYKWKDNGRGTDMHVGSLAQYWRTICPEAVNESSDGYLSMQYDVLALLSAISIAKKTIDHERRISELERENALLRYEIEQLKAA